MGIPTLSIRLIVISAAAMLMGCAGPTVEQLRDPVPEPLVATASLPGYSHIRIWGDDGSGIAPEMIQTINAQASAAAKTDPSINPLDRKLLAVSGGGSN